MRNERKTEDEMGVGGWNGKKYIISYAKLLTTTLFILLRRCYVHHPPVSADSLCDDKEKMLEN